MKHYQLGENLSPMLLISDSAVIFKLHDQLPSMYYDGGNLMNM
jgi:hypothetical protein